VYSLRDTNRWRKQNDRERIHIGENYYEIACTEVKDSV